MTIRMNRHVAPMANFLQTVQMNFRLNSKNLCWAEIDQRDELGNSALYWAILHDNAYNALMLLNAGAIMDITPHKKALHCAIELNSASIFLMLLDHGADVDCQDSEGKTPLMYAIEKEDVSAVKYLLYKHASTSIVDRKNRCASDYLEQCNNLQIKQFVYDEIFFRAG